MLKEANKLIISRAIGDEIQSMYNSEVVEVYKKNQFCKFVNCEHLEEVDNNSHCGIEGCIASAKEFHIFLSNHNMLLEEKKIKLKKDELAKEIANMIR